MRMSKRRRWIVTLSFFVIVAVSLRFLQMRGRYKYEYLYPPLFEPQTPTNKSSKVVLYITTHFSDLHIRYLHCCWPTLVQKSPLIGRSNIIIASTNATPVPQDEIDFLKQLFANNPSYQFWTPLHNNHLNHCEPYKLPLNPKKKTSVSYKQCLANYGVAFGWPRLHQQYDWMIRLNPDVLIRNSQWILSAMTNTSLDAIFIHCGPGTRQIHTDFWAIRPKAVNMTHAFQHMARIGNHLNHERTAFQHFRPILANKRHMLVPNMDPSDGVCRARGSKAPISHTHNSCSDDDICHELEGWDLTL